MEAIFMYQVEFCLCGVRGLQLGTADWYIMDNEDEDFINDQVWKLTKVMSVPPDELEDVKETIRSTIRTWFRKFLLVNEESHLKQSPLKDQRTQSSCLLYTSPSPRDQRGSRMPSSA